MPFKKGVSGNLKGAPKRERFALKWEVIDRNIVKGSEFLGSLINDTNEDLKALEDPKDRLELKIKAVNALMKLAPQRHANEEGGPFTVVLKKYD